MRDAARSNWVNGVSHDIRTPLSMVMGYANQLEEDPALPPARREQAAIIRRQSQTIRDLVNDLNLTMRLDYEMQPLRRARLRPAALVRQAAADLINGGLEDRYTLDLDIPPEAEEVTLLADEGLLKRALMNLMNNGVRHNPDGCAITVRLALQEKACVLEVDSAGGPGAPDAPPPSPPSGLNEDGSAPHGTGLRLVEQIARAHGGRFEIVQSGTCFCGRIVLPADTAKM